MRCLNLKEHRICRVIAVRSRGFDEFVDAVVQALKVCNIVVSDFHCFCLRADRNPCIGRFVQLIQSELRACQRLLIAVYLVDFQFIGENGDSVRWGYYAQDTTESVDSKTVFDRIYDRFPRMDPKEIKNALAAFLFRGDEIGKKISDLSGGELARIRLLELMLSRRDTLFLDEPTNYLDIASREQLEDAIMDFPGTCLVVSHDRYFIERIADRILILTEDGIREFSGDWDEYVQICQQNRQKRRKRDAQANRAGNAYLAGKEQRSAANRVRARFREMERRIQILEEQISEYENRLADPDVASDYLKAAETSEALEQAQKRHEELLAEWIELEEQISGFGE